MDSGLRCECPPWSVCGRPLTPAQWLWPLLSCCCHRFWSHVHRELILSVTDVLVPSSCGWFPGPLWVQGFMGTLDTLTPIYREGLKVSRQLTERSRMQVVSLKKGHCLWFRPHPSLHDWSSILRSHHFQSTHIHWQFLLFHLHRVHAGAMGNGLAASYKSKSLTRSIGYGTKPWVWNILSQICVPKVKNESQALQYNRFALLPG